jgi:hypothetical protein
LLLEVSLGYMHLQKVDYMHLQKVTRESESNFLIFESL